jgi:membrane protein
MQGETCAPNGRLPISSPAEIPLRNFWRVLKEIYVKIDRHQVFILAAGIAFYAMFAVFPFLIALVSIYGLVSDPAAVAHQVEVLSEIMPATARPLVHGFLREIAVETTGLSVGLVTGLLVALWSASTGVAALINGVNFAYNQTETRSFVAVRALALALTVVIILFMAIAFMLVAVLPGLLSTVGSDAGARLVAIARWPVLTAAVLLGCGYLYRLAPCRADPGWRWVGLGSVVATGVWLTASALFSLYASNFGNFSRTYGALAGVMVLLMWFFISAFALLLGAEINSELEAERKRLLGGARRPWP